MCLKRKGHPTELVKKMLVLVAVVLESLPTVLRSWRSWSRGVKSVGGEAARGLGRKRLKNRQNFDPVRTKPPATHATHCITFTFSGFLKCTLLRQLPQIAHYFQILSNSPADPDSS